MRRKKGRFYGNEDQFLFTVNAPWDSATRGNLRIVPRSGGQHMELIEIWHPARAVHGCVHRVGLCYG